MLAISETEHIILLPLITGEDKLGSYFTDSFITIGRFYDGQEELILDTHYSQY